MKKFLKALGVIVVLLIVAAAIAWFGFLKPAPPPISDEDRAQITLIPLPSEMELGTGTFEIDIDFGHSIKGISSNKIEKGLSRFYSRLGNITEIPLKAKEGNKLIIDCKKANDNYPSLKDDESYSLKISGSEIELSANSDTGILYGLESLLQLARKENDIWVFPELTLKDNPRFPWRGLMIDAARHWVSKETILRNLDAMAAVKLNVLHWHLTEYQGFRVASKKYPKLHEMGSQGGFYSQDDIKEVVEYASDLGIRVIPEFDMPGHTTAWFVGYPELASAPGPYVLDSVFGILDPVMDPTRDEVYDFLDGFIGEMAELFPDEYLHIGGDEVKPKQWEENPEIQKFMQENNIADPHELQAYFNIRLQKIVAKHGKLMMGWDEILHPDLPKEGIAVQSWRSHKSLWDVARSGNKAVLSAGYYLDHKRPASFHYTVDPMQITGAVTIDIDSTNWKGYECTLYVQDTEIDGHVYFFGEGDNLRGVMNFMDTASDFSNVQIEGQKMTFAAEASVGTINYELTSREDSIHGQASIAMFTIDIKGKQTGGSDMPEGEALPKFEKIQPLTETQQKNILGGEACQWSEMVDNRTIDSRIWPRAAVIAEKLWSPSVLTANLDDMYRRLMVLDDGLVQLGINHKKSGPEIIQNIVEEPYQEPLQTLVDVLQEDEFFNRMLIYKPQLYTTTALDRIVDAARPESYVAYAFNKDVDAWLENDDTAARTRIEAQLKTWSVNHKKLLPAFGLPNKYIEDSPQSLQLTENNDLERYERLKEVQPHSENLSVLAQLALDGMTGKAIRIQTDALFTDASKGHGGTVLPIESGLKKLINHNEN